MVCIVHTMSEKQSLTWKWWKVAREPYTCYVVRLLTSSIFSPSVCLYFLNKPVLVTEDKDEPYYLTILEPELDKTNKMTCVPSEDSDQPVQQPLFSQYALLLVAQAFFMRLAMTLMELGRWPGWSESSLDARVILLVLSCSSSLTFQHEP